MRLKYIAVYAGNFEEQLEFYTAKLGFKVIGSKPFYDDADCTLLQADSYEVLLALSAQNPHTSANGCIILNTNDCLNDHHKLKTRGVDFLAEPQYQPIGLVAEFADPSGNRFVLLEERDYNE